MKHQTIVTALWALALSQIGCAQPRPPAAPAPPAPPGAPSPSAGGRITVPFSDPARPRILQGSLVNACFTVEGYDGKEVIVEASHRQAPRPPHRAEGMTRIEPNGLGISVEEENNVVRIKGLSPGSGSILIKVPHATSLKLKCLNGGNLTVDRVAGDLELENLNGSVNASNVSGSVLAHSLNGKINVAMSQVTPGKPLSFSTLNGNVDITLPADTKASVSMKTDNGAMYSDFEMKLNLNSPPLIVEDGRAKGGRYRVRTDNTTSGTINGGGSELTVKTLNGNIYIRKMK